MPVVALPLLTLPLLTLPVLGLIGLVPAALVLPAVLALGPCLPGLGSGPGLSSPGWAAPVGPPATVLRPFAPPPASAPWLPGHRGVDLAVAAGGSVRADGAGTVTYAAAVAGVPVVVLDHGGGLRSTFEPVVATVPVGTGVRAGDLLGHLGVWWLLPGPGTPGRLGGHCRGQPCLHWGMVRAGSYVDPLAVTGVVTRCRTVRLLPVDPDSALAPEPAGPLGVAPPATGGMPAGPAGPGSAAPAPGAGAGPGGTAGAVAVLAVVAAGVAVPSALAVTRRRRAPRSGAGPP
jgi:hypothetical protein